MKWIAPSEKDAAQDALENSLWEAADQLRANCGLKSQECSAPVLGLVFLRFADARFNRRRAALEKAAASSRRGSRLDDPTAYHAEGVLYLPPTARSTELLEYPEGGRNGQSPGKAINEAMEIVCPSDDVLARCYRLVEPVFSEILSLFRHSTIFAGRATFRCRACYRIT